MKARHVNLFYNGAPGASRSVGEHREYVTVLLWYVTVCDDMLRYIIKYIMQVILARLQTAEVVRERGEYVLVAVEVLE